MGDSTAADGSASADGDGGSAPADLGSLSADGGGSASADGGGSASADGSGSASADGGGSASADGGAPGVDPCGLGCPDGVCDESTGKCVACLSDLDCAQPTPYCDLTTNECEECLTDAQCPAQLTCDPDAHVCSCVADDQCAADEACNDIGECVPADVPGRECVDSTDCDPSLGCGAGYCLRCQGNGGECTSCVEDQDCGAVFFCNVELASCVFCLTSADCNVDAGEICHPYGECDQPCDADADCPQGRLCDEHARCVPPPPGSNCAADADCPAGAQCVTGLCKACETAADGVSCQACQPGQGGCGDDYLCDYDVFVCVSCRSDADCSAGEVCQAGACTVP